MGEGQEEEEVLLALREEGLNEGLCQQIIRDLGYDTLSVLGTLAMVKEEEIKNRFDEPWRFAWRCCQAQVGGKEDQDTREAQRAKASN